MRGRTLPTGARTMRGLAVPARNHSRRGASTAGSKLTSCEMTPGGAAGARRGAALPVGHASRANLRSLSTGLPDLPTHRCGSSLSSTMPAPCGKFSITSVNQRSRQKSPRRAGRRCGRPQELRSKRAMILNGICRRSLYRSSNSISTSPGDEQFFLAMGALVHVT